jgi:uncharacterized phage protein gp47/JayE
MATYPLPTLAPTIDATGISAPPYNDVYQSLIALFKNIYGQDIYVEPDSQDGQWIAVLAQAMHECNQAAIACFRSFSPTYSQGAALSSLVKLNGISRNVATNSTAEGTVVGTAGTVITDGVVQDAEGNLWDLPSPTTISLAGSVSVTITAQKEGALAAPIGTITKIYNPQFGWQSFSNTSTATLGAPVQSDAELRVRRAGSVATPALSIKDAISAAVANVVGVTRSFVYENDTGSTNADGIPSHSLSVVVLGGDSADIAAAIARRKTPGAQTYGTTTVNVYDQYGLPTPINYFILAITPVYYTIEITALLGYVASTGVAIQQALADFTNALSIGEDVYITQAQAVASLQGLGIGKTFYISDFALGFSASPSGTSNLTIAFNAAASSSPASVDLTVV